MKLIKPFFWVFLAALPAVSGAQIATTAGSNLTAWNGNSGATNNNNWNQLTNARAQTNATAPKADFGNCNSLIMRCAQPKCTGCTTIEIARPIVAGCVNSNATCKQHGDDLIDYIAAQLVASANQKAQQAQLAADTAAAQAAAMQSNMQIQQMQQQMNDMQNQMQLQTAKQMQDMQNALEEQKALFAAAQNEANAARQEAAAITSNIELTTSEQSRASSGEVSAQLMARERIQGQILSDIESAEDAMKNLKSTMQNIFSYAGCDSRGNNCRGPRRVSVFKQKAMQFFDPFDNVADAMYSALEKALAVGVDVSDVVMMLSGACNQWGKYMCEATNSEGTHEAVTYNANNCRGGRSVSGGRIKGGMECSENMLVPPQDDNACTLIELIDSDNTELVERQWLSENYEDDGLVRMGCATSSLDSLSVFGRRRSKKQSALDLDTLEMLISQDSMDGAGSLKFTSAIGDNEIDRIKYCGMSNSGYQRLVSAVRTKKLPKEICVSDYELTRNARTFGKLAGMEMIYGYDYTLLPGIGEKECTQYSNDFKTANEKYRNCDTEWKNNTCRLTGGCVYHDGGFYISPEEAGVSVDWPNYEKSHACIYSGGSWNYEDGNCECPPELNSMSHDGRCEKAVIKMDQKVIPKKVEKPNENG